MLVRQVDLRKSKSGKVSYLLKFPVVKPDSHIILTVNLHSLLLKLQSAIRVTNDYNQRFGICYGVERYQYEYCTDLGYTQILTNVDISAVFIEMGYIEHPVYPLGREEFVLYQGYGNLWLDWRRHVLLNELIEYTRYYDIFFEVAALKPRKSHPDLTIGIRQNE